MLKQMQYFISVVEAGSFTKAAEECYISQSAISQQIRALEESLQVKLLIRGKRSFSLTAAGEYFYDHSREILNEMNVLCRKTKEIEDDENVLKIGFLRGYHGKEIRDTIIAFNALYPDVSVGCKRGNHEELYECLVNGETSLIISDQRRAFHEDYVNDHLLDMGCYVEFCDGHPLSRKEYVDVEELKSETCIIVVSKEQRETEREFHENIIGLKCRYLFAEDMDEARLLVTINKGFMPVEYAHGNIPDYPHIRSVPLHRHGKQLTRNYCIFWKKERTHYYIEEFADMLKERMKEVKSE